MTKNIRLIAMLALAIPAIGAASAQPSTAVHYSQSEVRKMIRQAHTPQQYQTLAAYFKAEQQAYERQAQSEKAEWERRSQNVTGLAAKYPRPVDSSKNRYEYFTYEAGQKAQQAAHFESLSATAR
jgi:hypothetical protein